MRAHLERRLRLCCLLHLLLQGGLGLRQRCLTRGTLLHIRIQLGHLRLQAAAPVEPKAQQVSRPSSIQAEAAHEVAAGSGIDKRGNLSICAASCFAIRSMLEDLTSMSAWREELCRPARVGMMSGRQSVIAN